MKVLFFNGLFKLHFIEPTLQDVFCLQSVSGQLFSAVVFTKTPIIGTMCQVCILLLKVLRKKVFLALQWGEGQGGREGVKFLTKQC